MKRILCCVFVAVFALTLIPAVAFADQHEEAPTAYSMIHYDDVGPANSPAYEENAKDWVESFTEAGMGAEWEWRTYSGPNFNYVFITDVPNYAYLDGDDERWEAVVEVIGAEKIAELEAPGVSDAHRHELVKRMPELTYMPEGGMGEVGFVHLSRHSVKPGMGDQFKELVAEVVAARKQVGSSMAVLGSSVEFGQGSYQFVTIAKDAAAFYSAASTREVLTEAYGAEKAQALFDGWRSCITDYETSDWQFRPDLSYMSGMAEEMEMEMEEEMEDSSE